MRLSLHHQAWCSELLFRELGQGLLKGLNLTRRWSRLSSSVGFWDTVLPVQPLTGHTGDCSKKPLQELHHESKPPLAASLPLFPCLISELAPLLRGPESEERAASGRLGGPGEPSSQHITRWQLATRKLLPEMLIIYPGLSLCLLEDK